MGTDGTGDAGGNHDERERPDSLPHPQCALGTVCLCARQRTDAERRKQHEVLFHGLRLGRERLYAGQEIRVDLLHLLQQRQHGADARKRNDGRKRVELRILGNGRELRIYHREEGQFAGNELLPEPVSLLERL